MKDSENRVNYFDKKNKGFFKKWKVGFKNRLGWLGIPKLMLYRGFGSKSSGEFFITGVLVEDKGLAKPDEKNSWWQNLLAMLKRYSGDQIPDARIEIKFNDNQNELKTTETGLFKATLSFPTSFSEEKSEWLEYHATLLEKFDDSDNKYAGKGEILVPGNDAQFGIISDIDDTIMVSHSTQTLRKLRLMLTRNSRTRKPFPGVEAFYQALHKGTDGNSANPFFYISSSEWNLYDLIEDFCSYNNFPKGVFMLREIKPGLLNLWKQGGGTHEHKYEKIVHIFNTYPNLSFVLVGDNGQKDPIIYSRIANKYANRIKAIYIRTIKKEKDDSMKKIILDMEKKNIPIVFTPDSINAAQHALGENIITRSAVEDTIQNSLKD